MVDAQPWYGGGTDAFTKTLVQEFTSGNMNASGVILRGSLGTLDAATGLVGGLSGAVEVYSGPMRIKPLGAGRPVTLGSGDVVMRDTVISIPIASQMPHRDDLISVTDGDGDLDLDTRIFRVLGADGGGYFSDARRISCSGWFESRYWGSR